MRQRSLFGFVILALAASTAVAAPQQGQFLSNGVKIHYIEEGQGEPVLLIHGFSANAFVNWVLPGVFGNLAKHYHVIALDNRGHGASGKPHEIEKYGPEMVEDAVRLLDHLKIEKAHIDNALAQNIKQRRLHAINHRARASRLRMLQPSPLGLATNNTHSRFLLGRQPQQQIDLIFKMIVLTPADTFRHLIRA